MQQKQRERQTKGTGKRKEEGIEHDSGDEWTFSLNTYVTEPGVDTLDRYNLSGSPRDPVHVARLNGKQEEISPQSNTPAPSGNRITPTVIITIHLPVLSQESLLRRLLWKGAVERTRSSTLMEDEKKKKQQKKGKKNASSLFASLQIHIQIKNPNGHSLSQPPL